MKFVYIPDKGYFQGLPAEDLDDVLLTDEQKKLLGAGVALGMYVPQATAAPKRKTGSTATKDDDDPAPQG